MMNKENCFHNTQKVWHLFLPSFSQFKYFKALLSEDSSSPPQIQCTFEKQTLKKKKKQTFNISSQLTPALFIFQISVP